MALLKLFLFGLVLILMVIAGLATYRWLNKKIIQSQKLTGVVGFTLLMFMMNLGILLGGVYLLITLYSLLFTS